MATACRVVAALLLAGCAAKPPEAPTPPAAAGAATDFGRMRTEYGDRQDYAALCQTDRPLKQFVELTNGQQYAEVLQISQPWLQHCPVDIDARFVTAVALTELGRKPEAEEQVRWYKGLVESVLATGDGKTPASAFTVISVEEEYAVMRALQLRPTAQALTEDHIDAVTITAPDGKATATIYFNPAAHFRRMGAALGTPQ